MRLFSLTLAGSTSLVAASAVIGDLASDPSTTAQALQAGGTAGLILGLIYAVVALARGWVVPGSRLRESEARNVLLEAENKEQAVFIRDQAVPLLVRVQDVVLKMVEERKWDERARQRPPSP